MSDDPDFPKANHALQVLRQARLSRNEAAAIMLADLVCEMASAGLRTPEIEEARQAAWVAISALVKTLKEEGFAAPAQRLFQHYPPEPAVDPEPYFHRQTIQTKGHAGITPHGLCETVPPGPPESPSRGA
jgi:hypothetical protein